jgi:hypothetical protein
MLRLGFDVVFVAARLYHVFFVALASRLDVK